jgi:hypothetical protein
VDRGCAAYSTDCYGPMRACMPGDAEWNKWDFYSPGLSCPVGFTTATLVSANMTDGLLQASVVLDGMLNDETAAFCCPE